MRGTASAAYGPANSQEGGRPVSKCDRYAECPFFNGRLANYAPAIVDSMKREFCNGDYERCARYRVFQELGKGYAPADMTPIDQDQADQILAGKKKPVA